MNLLRLALGLVALSVVAPAGATESDGPVWAIALHGGAGSLGRDLSPERKARYHAELGRCLAVGVEILESGGSALDAAEQTVMALEDCPLFNAGRGSVYDQAGGHGMDASIMVGSTGACGGVATVRSIRNPIRGARIVMEQTPHVVLGGVEAERLAAKHGARLAPPNYFSTRPRFERLQKTMRKEGLTPPEAPLYGWSEAEALTTPEGKSQEEAGGTVGCVALDLSGELVAATSTGGRNNKLPGRIGDSPIPAAGNYANEHVAVGGTGKGEEYLRHFVTGRVGLLVESGERGVDDACRYVLEEVLQPGDGGLIAVDKQGAISMRSTTGAMPRAAADSTGRRETKIWFD